MSIRRYAVERIDVDYYTIREEELVIKSSLRWDGQDVIVKERQQWDFICSIGDQWPEYYLPEQAQRKNPRQLLKRDGDSYVFFACVYDFPCPRLMGKFSDYTSANGWGDE